MYERTEIYYMLQTIFRYITSAAPISGPFDALIDDGITFNASIKKAKIPDAEKGLSSSMFPVKSNKRGSDFP